MISILAAMKYLASFVHVGMSAYERFHLIAEPQNDWDWRDLWR